MQSPLRAPLEERRRAIFLGPWRLVAAPVAGACATALAEQATD